MGAFRPVEKAWGNPFGRLAMLLVGVALVVGSLFLYPQIRPVIEWAIPVSLVLWGISRFYLYEGGDTLTSTAGCLLILGGLTVALYQLIPMDEFTGAVAYLVPTTGIFVELFAEHYRDEN